jgi:hypothetical protein
MVCIMSKPQRQLTHTCTLGTCIGDTLITGQNGLGVRTRSNSVLPGQQQAGCEYFALAWSAICTLDRMHKPV